MRVSRLTKNNDWQFGRSHDNYITKTNAIKQNIVTRLKSFANDWFLDLSANIDWLTLLGEKNTKDEIYREVTRVILGTENVVKITSINISEDRANRTAILAASVSTIFSTNIYLNTRI